MNPYMCIPGNLRKFMQETHFSQARYIRAPEGKGVTPLQWAFELFGQRSAALVAALNGDVDHRIVLHCGDAFALCDALLAQPRAWLPSEVPKVEELARHLGRAKAPHKFDIIDTSNLADYSMFLPLLVAAGPLLADQSDNYRATLATDLMSPKGNSYEDLFRQYLCEVPLWLVPLACGLQVDFMHAENSCDSAARSDLRRLWTAYPQSTVSISAAILSPGMLGATPVRWRRCQSTFERISINHSAELKAAIVSFIGRCSRSLRDSPCGISTCVRFLDMLALSGSLVDVGELCGLLAEDHTPTPSYPGWSSDAHLGPLPRASDEVLGSLSAPGGWLNLDIYSRSIPLPIRASQAWGMYKLRDTLNAQYGHSRVLGDRVHGKYWGGRGPVLLRAKDGSPDVLVLLSADVRYDWTYGLLVNGAACVLTEDVMKKANTEIFGSLPLQIRPESLDAGSGEASVWRDQYLPAAAELARVTRGLSGTPKCVCGSDEDHGRNCKRAQKFWLTWL
ncbi:hypothetical protein FOZ63_022186, partial [Perkinsus olseni]